MKYKASDPDVPKYLTELKALIYTLGASSSTGTENLKVIVSFINDNIFDVIARSKEHISFLSIRYTRAVSTLNSLNNTANKSNNLDARYNFNKSMQKSIKNTSLYMKVVNMHIDQDLSVYSQQIAEYRREVESTRILIGLIQQQIDYLEDFSSQIPELLSLCSST
jgi:hypothetical protein